MGALVSTLGMFGLGSGLGLNDLTVTESTVTLVIEVLHMMQLNNSMVVAVTDAMAPLISLVSSPATPVATEEWLRKRNDNSLRRTEAVGLFLSLLLAMEPPLEKT